MIRRLLIRLNLEPDRVAAGLGLTLGMLLAWLAYALYFEPEDPRGVEIERHCVEAPYTNEERGTRPRCIVFRRVPE